jgi:hypothetical protein
MHKADCPRRGRYRGFCNKRMAFNAQLNGGQVLAECKIAQVHHNRKQARC